MLSPEFDAIALVAVLADIKWENSHHPTESASGLPRSCIFMPSGLLPRREVRERPTSSAIIMTGARSFRLGCHAKCHGHFYQVCEGGRHHLTHHFASVCLHRNLGDAEFAGGMLIQPAGDHKCHHFTLALAQRNVSIPQEAVLLSLAQRGLTTR